jgi:hypothetical protein
MSTIADNYHMSPIDDNIKCNRSTTFPQLQDSSKTAPKRKYSSTFNMLIRRWFKDSGLLLRPCGMVLGIGIGELHGQAFRIAHMGHIDAPMILGTLGVIEVGLQALEIPHGKGGTEAASTGSAKVWVRERSHSVVAQQNRLGLLARHARAEARSASSRWISRASTSSFVCSAKTWMAGHRRAKATPSFGRLCPAMTGSMTKPGHDGSMNRQAFSGCHF